MSAMPLRPMYGGGALRLRVPSMAARRWHLKASSRYCWAAELPCRPISVQFAQKNTATGCPIAAEKVDFLLRKVRGGRLAVWGDMGRRVEREAGRRDLGKAALKPPLCLVARKTQALVSDGAPAGTSGGTGGQARKGTGLPGRRLCREKQPNCDL